MDRSKITLWKGCGSECPSQEVVFFAQISVIFMIIISAIVNLALHTGMSEFWVSIMSACLGYILPAPNVVFKKKSALDLDGTESLSDNHAAVNRV